MKIKQVVTGILLLFVVGSVAYMIARERKAATVPPETEEQTASTHTQPQEQSRQVIVYYFHGDMRCPTCHKLESYAKEAVESNFADQLDSKLIQWKPVNVDQSENAHFVKDYNLVTKAVILSDVIDGKEADWKNLDKIWDLVGDKDVYVKYISDKLATFIGQEHS